MNFLVGLRCTSNYAHCFARPVSQCGTHISLWDCLVQTHVLRRLEMPIVVIKHLKSSCTLPKAKNLAPGLLEHTDGHVHGHLCHRLDTTTLGFMAQHQRVWVSESILPNKARQAPPSFGELAHQIVGNSHSSLKPLLNKKNFYFFMINNGF